MNENTDTGILSKLHEIDKRLALVELKIETVKDLQKTATDLKEAVTDIKTEYEKMKAYSKGKNWVLGIWCGATGIVCTGLFMLGQVLLQKL